MKSLLRMLLGCALVLGVTTPSFAQMFNTGTTPSGQSLRRGLPSEPPAVGSGLPGSTPNVIPPPPDLLSGGRIAPGAGGGAIGPNGIRSGLDAQQKSPWAWGVEFGLNGTEGNTRVLKLRTGVDVRYDTPEDAFVVNAFHGYARQQGILNENKALLNARNELALYDNVGWFQQLQIEYDEFRAIDLRAGLYTGGTFNAIKDDMTLLSFRAGVGVVWESLPNDDSRWLAEGVIGFDFNQKITEKTAFVSSLDYYWDLGRPANFRIRSRAAFEILLDPDLNLTMRIGIQDRYDSRPQGSKKNDLDYFVTFLLRF